jgi:hypothetical protein
VCSLTIVFAVEMSEKPKGSSVDGSSSRTRAKRPEDRVSYLKYSVRNAKMNVM